MSRRYPTSQHPRIYLKNIPDNPYQPTTYHRPVATTTTLTPNGCPPDCALLTDEGTFTDTNTYYEYQVDGHRRTSEDSGSRLSHYEELASRRHSRTNNTFNRSARGIAPVHRVHPEAERLYHEVRCPSEVVRLPERPQSSLSSGVASTIVYGCGGRCQTFENVCYYFLQVAFTMGILIGTSLCIAGAVLRKSAAKNLQVLVYIGAMLSLVSALLLGVQCNARSSARKRQKAIRAAKMRAPIPLETLRQPTDTVGRLPQGFATTAFQAEQPCVPWWRRNDLNR